MRLAMRIIKLAWVGTRTDNAEPTVAFFRDVLGLRLELDRPGFWMLKLPDGSKVEIFGPDSPVNRHFTSGPVAGFLVDDIHAATNSCGPPAWRSCSSPGSTTAATPGSTSAPRTATSMSSPRTLASPDHTSVVPEPSRLDQPEVVTYAWVGRRSTRRRSWALRATTMVEALIRTAPRAGARVIPAQASTPAASGTARRL
jgi:hypothetical protein